ncbi:MAG: chorismate mutase [Candidatus Bathyarchaeia archaeon]
MELRKKIDEIDEKILHLLKERIEVSIRIGTIKREKGLPIRDVEREREKMEQITKKAEELKLDVEFIKSIYKSVIDISAQAQEASHI